MRVRWSRRAQADLGRIGRRIAKDKPGAARRWVEHLRDRARNIGATPLAGRIAPEHGDGGLRELIEGHYRIVYRLHARRIEIVTVFEGHRQFPPLDPGDDPST